MILLPLMEEMITNPGNQSIQQCWNGLSSIDSNFSKLLQEVTYISICNNNDYY